MESALSAGSALAGLLSVSIQVAQMTQAHASRVAHLPRSVTLYLSELISLKRLSGENQDALLLQCVAPGVDAVNCQNLPMELGHILTDLEQIHEKLQHPQVPCFTTAVRNLVWPVREDEMVEWANNLGECRDRIQAITLASNL
jgi:hypothetical protein